MGKKMFVCWLILGNVFVAINVFKKDIVDLIE